MKFLEILTNLTKQGSQSYNSKIGNIRYEKLRNVYRKHTLRKLLYGMNNGIKRAIRVEDGLATYRVLSM